MNILAACSDGNLFGPWFRDRETWAAWFAFLAALFALPITPEQLAAYQVCTGRPAPPAAPVSEAWLVCGRRAGKSFILALIAVFLACFHDLRQHLAPGERGTVLVIAADRKQARVILRYIRGLLTGIPMLTRMIERETAESFDLTNGITVEVGTANFRSVRGYAIVAALCDEIAFWFSEDSASPDYEVLTALRPGMSTIPGAMLLCASSPYARKGALWDAYRRHYGKDDDRVLVWQAATRAMNPTVPQSIIDEALEKDPSAAAAEWLATFRTDVETLLSREAVVRCVTEGVIERAPDRRHRYHAFTDPSGGSADAFTLAIAHKEGDTVLLDAMRERRPPFSPEAVVEEYADLMRRYRIARVTGDRYAGEWPREQFRKRGIHYATSEKSKSELYLSLVPAINSGAVDLLGSDRLILQLCGLERRVTRGGRDSIDHPPGGHDDLANAVAGALVTVPSSSGFPARAVQHQSASKYSPYGFSYHQARRL